MCNYKWISRNDGRVGEKLRVTRTHMKADGSHVALSLHPLVLDVFAQDHDVCVYISPRSGRFMRIENAKSMSLLYDDNCYGHPRKS